MNAPHEEIDRRRKENERVRLLFDDFLKAETPTIERATEAFRQAFAEALPRLQGYAIESGNMVQNATLVLEIDLTKGKRAVSFSITTTPPPCGIERRVEVKY